MQKTSSTQRASQTKERTKVWEPQRELGVFTIIQLIPYCWSIAGQVERGSDRVGQRDTGCGVS